MSTKEEKAKSQSWIESPIDRALKCRLAHINGVLLLVPEDAYAGERASADEGMARQKLSPFAEPSEPLHPRVEGER